MDPADQELAQPPLRPGHRDEETRVVQGEVKVREILNPTVGFNHDVVDGVPARRFMQRLIRRMEAGTAGAEQRPAGSSG